MAAMMNTDMAMAMAMSELKIMPGLEKRDCRFCVPVFPTRVFKLLGFKLSVPPHVPLKGTTATARIWTDVDGDLSVATPLRRGSQFHLNFDVGCNNLSGRRF